jgi:hypothetical protein
VSRLNTQKTLSSAKGKGGFCARPKTALKIETTDGFAVIKTDWKTNKLRGGVRFSRLLAYLLIRLTDKPVSKRICFC